MEASSHNAGISRSTRNLKPADYLFKIESYSLVMIYTTEKYESNVFQAGGCKWKLVLYPTGKWTSNNNYVSLYLAIADPRKISRGGKVNVNFKLFLTDQKNGKYLTIQDGGMVRTFCAEKTEWGFEELILVKDLFDKDKGYYDNDSCEFGAEVFVIGGDSRKSETLSLVKNPHSNSFKWKLHNFSTLDSLSYESEPFAASEGDWILRAYPRGSDTATRDKYLSLYVELKNCAPNRTVYATYTLKILDERHRTIIHKKIGSSWFRPSAAAGKLVEALDLANKLHGAKAATNDFVKGTTTEWMGDSAAGKLSAVAFGAGKWMKAGAGMVVKGAADKLVGDSEDKWKRAQDAVSNLLGSHAGGGFAEFISLSELNEEGKYVKENAMLMEFDIKISMIKISS